MANSIAYHEGTTGYFYYAKPRDTVVVPYSDDAINFVENGTTGEFKATLDDTKAYRVYQAVNGLNNKAATDPVVATIDPDQDEDIEAKLDVILPGTGSKTVVLTISTGTVTVVGADVYITSDLAGQNTVVYNLVSNELGKITAYLNPGTYYVWSSHPEYTFNNPATITVV